MPRLEYKPLTWFRAEPQVRQRFDDLEELKALGGSLRVRQLQPVVAKPDGTLVAGGRRYKAAELEGLDGLWAVILEDADLLTPTDTDLARLAENLHRSALSPWEVAQAVRRLTDAHPDWTGQELANRLHFEPSSVTRYLAVGRCVPAVQAALADGRLGLADTYEISKADPADQDGLLALKLAGASREALQRAVRSRRPAAPAPAVKLDRVVLRLPAGTVTVAVAGGGLELDALAEVLTAAAKEVRKAKDQRLNVRTLVAALKDRTAAPDGGAA